ncbi:hypothetical protein MMC2321_04690 [Chitinophaga sp. MM2321]
MLYTQLSKNSLLLTAYQTIAYYKVSIFFTDVMMDCSRVQRSRQAISGEFKLRDLWKQPA